MIITKRNLANLTDKLIIFLILILLLVFILSIDCSSPKWKTYINEKYEFSFQYPSKWVVEDNSNNIANSQLVLWIEFNKPKIGDITGIKLKIWDDEVYEFLNGPDNYKPFTINNINAFKNELYGSTFIIMPLKNGMTLKFIYFCENYDKKAQEMKEKVISSLQYVNQ